MHENDPLLALINHHRQLYRELGVRDIYKLLYQGTMGPGHLMANPERARDYLFSEWQLVPIDTEAPLLVPVSPDGSIVRINIAPAKVHNISPTIVWHMLFNTASEFREDKHLFLSLWQQVHTLIRDGALDHDIADWQKQDDEAAARDYPALHHSQAYRVANYPAYRVIYLKEYIKIDTQAKE